MAVSPERELLERIDALIARGVLSVREVVDGARRPPERRLEAIRVDVERDDDGERGQTVVEYAVLLGFLAIATIVALQFLTFALNSLFSDAALQIGTPPVEEVFLPPEVVPEPTVPEPTEPIPTEPEPTVPEPPVEPEPAP